MNYPELLEKTRNSEKEKKKHKEFLDILNLIENSEKWKDIELIIPHVDHEDKTMSDLVLSLFKKTQS